MTDDSADERAWFASLRPGDPEAASAAITDGSAEDPADWPRLAVEADLVEDEDAYYEWLHAATVEAARSGVSEREQAPDQQLVHAVRAMDDAVEQSNQLAELVEEWANAHFDDVDGGAEYVQDVAGREPAGAVGERIVSLATRVVDLRQESDELRTFLETETPRIAPNLAALAGPLLAARLIALAGGLHDLARKPSGTLQVLGAEDALFAHLDGRAPSPKHGAIYTHEYVRNTRPADRGSAARALAGKLTIAARVDHYSGERKPELDEELDARIEQIRSRGGS